MNKPPGILLKAIEKLQSDHDFQKGGMRKYIAEAEAALEDFGFPGWKQDHLFKADYQHRGGEDCEECDIQQTEKRLSRTSDNPVIHYGLIASANAVMKSAKQRDKLRDAYNISCFEMEAAGLMDNFRCLVIRGICDYSDDHKNKLWQPYAALVAAAYAKNLLEVIQLKEVKNTYTAVDRENVEKVLLQTLYTCPYSDRKDRNNIRVEGTCEWFTNHRLFQHWNESKESSLLLVSADPGCGKSVLARYLVDEVIPRENRTTCYFFFKDDFTDQRSAANAICAILRQIFLQRPDLLQDSILKECEREGTKLLQSVHIPWRILLDVAADQNAGEIVCILDALDECADGHRSDDRRHNLIQELCELYETKSQSRKYTLKFLVTSRPYDHMLRRFRQLADCTPIIRLSGEDEVEVEKIAREIDIVIRSRVQDVGARLRLEPDECDILLGNLISIPNRTYLWVALTLDVIENSIGITKGEISRVVKAIPKSVDDAYDKILGRSRDPKKTKRLLHIVTGAKRPLSLKEISLALVIQECHKSYSDIEQELEPETRFRNTIRDLCGLFVVIVDSKIYLLHQTAKEFLVRESSILSEHIDHLDSDNPFKWKYSLQSLESDRILTEVCVWYLNLPAKTQSVFLDYSAKNWVVHFRGAGIRTEETITASALSICDTNSKRYSAWFTIYSSDLRKVPKSANFIIIASYLGLEAIVKLLFQIKKADLNFKDNYGGTPLFWAIEQGHVKVIQLLLAKGAKVNVQYKIVSKFKDNRF